MRRSLTRLACLATRLHNFPNSNRSFTNITSSASAVPAPCVLARRRRHERQHDDRRSRDEGRSPSKPVRRPSNSHPWHCRLVHAPLERDNVSSNRRPAVSLSFEHDLLGKPVPTFPDHALIDWNCLHTLLHSSQSGCATNARKRAAPSPCEKTCCELSRTMRQARQRRVCRFVAGRYSLSAQRRANKRRSNASARTSVGSHADPIRLVNEAAAARSGDPGIHYSHHAGEPSSSPTRFSINH